MAGNNGEIRIKREIEDDDDPLSIVDASAPKIIRLDGSSTSAIRFAPIAPKLTSVPTSKGPANIETNNLKGPDVYMLNKPPPIPFNLPKEASLAPRNVKDDPMNDPPHVALFKLEGEAKNLKEEVAALKWLAKRKEQEWNSILVLLKKKEENWMKVKRQAELVATDPTFNKLKTITNAAQHQQNSNNSPRMPSPPPPITVVRPPANAGSVKIVSKMLAPNASKVVNAATGGVISNPGGGPKKMLIPVSQPLTAENLEALRSQGLVKSGGMTADGKRIIIVKKSAGQLGGQLPGNLGGQLRIISKASINSGTTTTASTGVKVVTASSSSPTIISSASLASSSKTENKKAPSLCQACYKVPPKFECSGCSNMWYCSQICQKDNWTSHQHKCKTVIKQEVPDEIA